MLLKVFNATTIGLCLVVLFWWSKRLYNLAINYREARKLGLPIIVRWFSWQDLLFGIVRPYLGWLKCLPFDLGVWITFSDLAWLVLDAYKPHYKYGPAICMVSPGRNEIWVDDPQATSELLTNWRKWHKPPKFYRVFDVFGKNVLTIEGSDWQRQRKIINSAFTEQSHGLVWQSTRKQARQMLDMAFADTKPVDLFEIKTAVDTLAMHVLAAAIFGQDLDFDGGRHLIAVHHKRSFADTQRWILQQILWMILFGNLSVPHFLHALLPAKIKEVLATKKEYLQYMRESVDEMQNKDEKARTANNLITTIITSNDEAREDELVATGRRMYLTDDEIFANLFILNLAGFETTASTLSFAIPYLAAFPVVQDWVREEVDITVAKCDSASYDQVFPSLIRVMAVMYETLRLRGALQFSIKVNPEDQVLKLQDREIVVPGSTYVGLNMASVFRNPRYWGPDSEEWRPSRWIEHDSGTGKERLKDAPEGTIFVPWTAGPRVCPGKKFSQVEFAGTMLTILSRYHLDAVAKTGETTQQARERLLRVMSEIETHITPRVARPHEASIRFVNR